MPADRFAMRIPPPAPPARLTRAGQGGVRWGELVLFAAASVLLGCWLF